MDENTTLIFGEPAPVLVAALLPMFENRRTLPNGMIRAELRLEPELGEPLMRALMRAEAKLLLADADALGGPDYEARTDDQRRCDALVEIAEAMAELTPGG